MVYFKSFVLYLCVDVCHRFYQTPYSYIQRGNVGYQNFFDSQPEICNYCLSNWDASPLGNASGYTRFFFFSRDTNPNYTEIVFQNNQSLFQSGFNIQKHTKLLVHGWHDGGLKRFAPRVKDVYLAAQDVNIISVEWSNVAKLSYPLARVAVQPVGIYIAQFLDWLVTQTRVPLGSIHIIGHSLGAHIGGVVGEYLTTGQLSRITGLDPAGPGFSYQKQGRLDSSDALFVDVIHTSGWWAGYYDAIGAVDFYPNGGFPDQPGCPSDWGTCSHIRSYKLFMESITSVSFVARACNSWFDYTKGQCGNGIATMGEHVDSRARGRYYLYTAGQPPYAVGNITQLKRKWKPNPK